jgi:hypothetical protein
MRNRTKRLADWLTMVGVEGKESTKAKLGKGAVQAFKLRPETYFCVTAQFIISRSLLSTTATALTISRTKW